MSFGLMYYFVKNMITKFHVLFKTVDQKPFLKNIRDRIVINLLIKKTIFK